MFWQYTKIASEVPAKTIYEIKMRKKDMCWYKKILKTSRINGRLFEVVFHGRVNEALVNNDSTILIITVRLLVVFILFIPFYLFLFICSFCFIHVIIYYSCIYFIEHAPNMLIWIYLFLCTRSFISPLFTGEFDFVSSSSRMTFLV